MSILLDLAKADRDLFLADGGEIITVKRYGVVRKTIRGFYLHRTEPIFDQVKGQWFGGVAAVVLKEEDAADFDMADSLAIGRETFNLYGQPRPDRLGWVRWELN